MTDKEKIQLYLEHKGFSKNSFYTKTGLSIGFLDSGKSFGLDKLKLITDNYPDLSLDWLIFGTGDMIVESNSGVQPMQAMPTKEYKTISKKDLAQPNRIPHVVTVNSDGNENIPLVKTKVAAGYVGGLTEPEFISNLPSYNIPDLNNATFRMFEVSGNSMLPTLHPGDIVIGEFVEHFDYVRNDRVYIVVTHEDLLIKRCILKGDQLIAKSDNRNQGYHDIVFDMADIHELWYVQKRLTSQLPGPTDIYERIADLEGRLAIYESKHTS